MHHFSGYNSFKIKSLLHDVLERHILSLDLIKLKKKDKNCKTSKMFSYDNLFKDSLCWVYSQRTCCITLLMKKPDVCGIVRKQFSQFMSPTLFNNEEKTWCTYCMENKIN